jgi:hypothetical protein
VLSVGLISYVGGSLRYEHAVNHSASSYFLRLGGGVAVAAAADEGSGARILLGHVGHRWYSGAGYVAIEGGLIGYQAGNDEWKPLPSAGVAAGVKAGRFDVGLMMMFPLAGIGVSLGFDLAAP